MELPQMDPDDQSAPFEWSELLDFTFDEQLLLPLEDSGHHHQQQSPSPSPVPPPPPTTIPSPPQIALSGWAEGSDRIRKRDPRLVCENFLAGRIPCACPEMDAKMQEEEEEIGPGKKRSRVGRAAGLARCQVPGCEADISKLKGYHKRHRVCLKCANAGSVVLHGESKRYCQQCGKFHVLSDFDEGKRSCRRKLERHNNRRRRKSIDSRGTVAKGTQEDLLNEDGSSDGEALKDNTWAGSQVAERKTFLDPKDGSVSNLCSALESQNIQGDSFLTSVASGEKQEDKEKDSTKRDRSPSSYDNKSAYSSVCPTGRISFKLYDWNPAEFPRRLRHQIFQWLASMPVELEGYIRPGCTILTAFVSMPQFMWRKLLEDAASYVRDSVGPGGMLSGRGTVLVYLNNMVFRVLRDGTSVMKVKVAMRAPKLHYVYPPCFEAGKPMEFIACGSNLLQPKFRFLVSFGGQYLSHDYCVAFPEPSGEASVGFVHQLCRIYVPHTEPNFFGPAFIEVENESGLSNFIPILIGDEHVCSEIRLIQQECDGSNYRRSSQIRQENSLHDACGVSCSRQMAFSELILDIAWLLKWPAPDKIQHVMTSWQIQRLNCLLNFLITNESTSILERILQSLVILMDEIESGNVMNGATDADRRLFQKYVADARDLLSHKRQKDVTFVQQAGESVLRDSQSLTHNGRLSFASASSQENELKAETNSTALGQPIPEQKGESAALLSGEVSMNVSDMKERSRNSCNLMLSRKIIRSCPLSS